MEGHQRHLLLFQLAAWSWPFPLGPFASPPSFFFQEKTESLVQQYEAVSQLNSERYARLERAQVLVNQFWETYEELNPWIEETQALISQLPPPAIDHEQLKQQQDDMRVRGCRVRMSCLSVLHLFLLNFPLFFGPCSVLFGGACLCNASVPRENHLLCWSAPRPKSSSLPRKPGSLWISLLLVAGEKKPLCAFRVEAEKQRIPSGVPPWSCGEGRRLGKEPCQALCHSHVGKSRVPCAWRVLGHEIQAVSSSQDTITALGVLFGINRQRLAADF